MEDIQNQIEELKRQQESMLHMFLALSKQVDDLLWYNKVGDIARIDKVVFTGPPPANTLAQPPQDKGNPLKIHAYTFVPKNAVAGRKYPLLVFPHGGVHANFSTSSANVVRELIEQGYIIIAPEYRGSTGYGEIFYKLIDYGGLEIEDTYEARNWMVENEPLVDPERVGILGWSHGGLITLMNIFNHPEAYKAAYAGVPVSDLVARMGYKTEAYRRIFSADYHLGKTAYEDVQEYRRRSPAWNAEKLQTPLLIHTTTNDEDVNVLEVEHLIKALKAANKEFEYKIYENAPGGHMFNRIDTKLAKESRKEIYRFLAKYLNPPNPIL
ncbi:MAG: S9 family peptidase [Candidatus Fermentithermobacillus carboniphilus]|uniref:S9 family peptidase n=1 Tax=Candidatus Fermentithermobacillus carboniphilus TaxID=3085328 RepID=A0AAT9LD40_9FIRM|nr:MAG: S9 family peptidase [Candidatus Fermentithermobacillus carboniphilus]